MARSRRVFSEAQSRVMMHMIEHAKPQSYHSLAAVITKPHSGSYGRDGTRSVIQPKATIGSLVRKGMIEGAQTQLVSSGGLLTRGFEMSYKLTEKGKETAIRYASRSGR